MVALVLLPLGARLATVGARTPTGRSRRSGPSRRVIFILALVVGAIGGIYGIGGGSILAPILLALGLSVFDVAGAALAATFLTSVAGVITYQILQTQHGGTIAPDWCSAFRWGSRPAGSYTGARLQPHLPETVIRRMLGILVLLVAARYLVQGLTG